jgi:isoleucyl-tRNA synthetase
MSSLPPALNFPETEEGICKKWKEEDSFRQQNKLSEERGDDVSFFI